MEKQKTGSRDPQTPALTNSKLSKGILGNKYKNKKFGEYVRYSMSTRLTRCLRLKNGTKRTQSPHDQLSLVTTSIQLPNGNFILEVSIQKKVTTRTLGHGKNEVETEFEVDLRKFCHFLKYSFA